jgi:hypothetical protein
MRKEKEGGMGEGRRESTRSFDEKEEAEKGTTSGADC